MQTRQWAATSMWLSGEKSFVAQKMSRKYKQIIKLLTRKVKKLTSPKAFHLKHTLILSQVAAGLLKKHGHQCHSTSNTRKSASFVEEHARPGEIDPSVWLPLMTDKMQYGKKQTYWRMLHKIWGSCCKQVYWYDCWGLPVPQGMHEHLPEEVPLFKGKD